MADINEMRIFCAEQIEVPPELPELLKNYSKAVIRSNPKDIIDFSKKCDIYFENLIEERNNNPALSTVKIDSHYKK